MRSDSQQDTSPQGSDAIDQPEVDERPRDEALFPARQESAGPELTILPPPAVARQSAAAPPAIPGSSDPAGVQVTPHLLSLITGQLADPEAQLAAQKQHDLNEMVHRMLVIGLGVSTILMLIGLALDLVLGRAVPTQTPELSETLQRVGALRPSGFLTLGMLVLIATPILRVIGSIIAFAFERDWRYAGITFMVFVVVTFSLITGQA